MNCLNWLMDHILYQTFKIDLNISKKKHETVIDNPSIMICVNKKTKKIKFKIKTGYYLETLTSETLNDKEMRTKMTMPEKYISRIKTGN